MINNYKFGLLPRWKRLIDEYKKYYDYIELYSCDVEDFSLKLGVKHISCPILLEIPFIRPILYNLWLLFRIRSIKSKYIRFFGSVYPVMPILKFLSKAKFILSYQYDFFTSTYKDFGKFKGSIAYIVERFSVKYVDKIICTTNELSDVLIHRYGIKSEVNPNFVDLDLFKPIGTEDDFLFYAGRIVKSKGMEVIIEAFKVLKNKGINLKLYLAGNGEVDYYKELVIAEGLEENIVFLGAINQIKLVDYMSKCKMFLFVPISREGHPKALIEALACGAPCIVSNVIGNDQVIDSKNGVLIKPNNTNELVINIERILNNNEERYEYKKNAVQSAVKYDVNMVVKNEIEIIQNCFDVTVSIGGKWHFYEIVLALQEIDWLYKFYTSIYFKNNRIVNSSFGHKYNFKNRYDSRIKNIFIRTNFLSELIPKFLERLKILNEGLSLKLRCFMFDFITSIKCSKTDIFHSQDGFCLYTAQKLIRQGSIFICDRGIVGVDRLQNILNIEYEKFGIKKKYPDTYISCRTKKEHLLADYIFVPTKTVYNSLVEEGINPSKISIIPYGVDLSEFKRLHIKCDTKFRVIFVGNICLRKGIHYLLQAWENLNLKDAQLVMVGNIESGIEKNIEQYKHIFLHVPYVNQNELIYHYSNSDVFILPSLAEGSARVIYEAMACCLPVIYTDMSGSIARNGIDGFEIRARNVEDIMDRILYFYNNREQIEIMGNNASLWVENFTWENYRKNIIDTYKKILIESRENSE